MRIKLSHKVSVFFSIGFIFLVNSCTIYEPQIVSIPLMCEKNEVQLNGGFSILGGVYGSAAYAPGNHVALQIYGAAYPDNSNFQGTIGFYTKNKSAQNFEVYAGYGNGKGTEYTDSNNKHVYSNADYSLYFLQANFGQTNMGSAHIDYGFGIKTGIFDVTVKDDLFTTSTPYQNSALLIEPQAFVRMGSEKFKVGFQMNGTKIFINRDVDLSYEFYYPFNVGISLNFRIAPSLNQK